MDESKYFVRICPGAGGSSIIVRIPTPDKGVLRIWSRRTVLRSNPNSQAIRRLNQPCPCRAIQKSGSTGRSVRTTAAIPSGKKCPIAGRVWPRQRVRRFCPAAGPGGNPLCGTGAGGPSRTRPRRADKPARCTHSRPGHPAEGPPFLSCSHRARSSRRSWSCKLPVSTLSTAPLNCRCHSPALIRQNISN